MGKTEYPVHAWQFDLSLPKHLTFAQFDEMHRFLRLNGYYYALKAENALDLHGNDDGKLHAHGILVKDFATAHNNGKNDKRFGAKKTSHLKEKFFNDCKEIAAVTKNNKAAGMYGLAVHPLTSDHFYTYFQKEGKLRIANLPEDPQVMTKYFVSPKPKEVCAEWDAHVAYYKQEEFPMPATLESCERYFEYRMLIKKDLRTTATPLKRAADRDNLFGHLNGYFPKSQTPAALKKQAAAKKRKFEDEATENKDGTGAPAFLREMQADLFGQK